MSLDSELNKVFSEALPPRRPADDPNRAQRFMARKPAPKPSSPQQRGSDFASVRKGMRRPMVNLDKQVHNIDHMLNVTQKDPSQLGSTVGQIEKSFEGIFDPLKQVRSGVQSLRKAADDFGAEYVGEKQPTRQPGAVERNPEGDEDRAVNRAVTNVEIVDNEQDKLAAANQSWQEYQKGGGKMNRGEFYRALVRKLKAPSEKAEAEKRKLPNIGATKRYGEVGKRRGELQFKPGHEMPIESSTQRRKLTEAQNLGRLVPKADEDRLLNKILTNIEMVNNPNDKQNALRDGWIEYQQSGGKMNRGEFVAALSRKIRPTI